MHSDIAPQVIGSESNQISNHIHYRWDLHVTRTLINQLSTNDGIKSNTPAVNRSSRARTNTVRMAIRRFNVAPSSGSTRTGAGQHRELARGDA